MVATTPLDPCARELSAQGGNTRRTGPAGVEDDQDAVSLCVEATGQLQRLRGAHAARSADIPHAQGSVPPSDRIHKTLDAALDSHGGPCRVVERIPHEGVQKTGAAGCAVPDQQQRQRFCEVALTLPNRRVVKTACVGRTRASLARRALPDTAIRKSTRVTTCLCQRRRSFSYQDYHIARKGFGLDGPPLGLSSLEPPEMQPALRGSIVLGPVSGLLGADFRILGIGFGHPFPLAVADRLFF